MDVKLPNHQSDAAIALYIREVLHICFQISVGVLVYSCASVPYHHRYHVTCCPSSARHGRMKASVFFIVLQKQSWVCQTCQTQQRTKELLNSMSLMNQGPFKIYERVLKIQLQWTVITLEFKIVASSLRKWSVLALWSWCTEFPGD